MATLSGNTIASTYLGVLNVTGAVGADTVEVVTDGAGTSTSLSLSQQRATITLGSGAADDFIVDGTTLVVEGDNNRVGIGTAAPAATLEIRAADAAVVLSDSDLSSGPFTTPVDDDTFLQIKAFHASAGGADIAGYSAAASVEGLTLRGFVGHASPSPGLPAVVIRGGKLSGSDIGDMGATDTVFQVEDSNGTTDFFTILGSGNVGIGDTAPTEAKLSIVQATADGVGLMIDCSEGTVNSSDIMLRLRYSGDADASGAHFIRFEDATDTSAIGSVSSASGTAVAFNTTSDYRLKTDFKDLLDATDTINKLKLYNFEWKNGNTRSDGIIAHEAAEIYPQPISGNKDAVEMKTFTLPDGTKEEREVSSLQMVDYSKFVPLLLKAIQELSAKVDALENNNNQGESSNVEN